MLSRRRKSNEKMESRIQETLTIPEEDRLKTNVEDPSRLPGSLKIEKKEISAFLFFDSLFLSLLISVFRDDVHPYENVLKRKYTFAHF